MQSSPNDVYRPPIYDETPAEQPADRGRFDVLEAARENRIREAKADLERYYFAKAALVDDSGFGADARSVQKTQPEQGPDMSQILPYVKHLGEFINYERDEETK